MKSIITALIFTVLFCFWGGIRIFNNIEFNQGAGGYLSRAASANTIEIATVELDRAIKYIEANNLTSGYTSVLFRTPDEDIGFWYENIKAANKELKELPVNSSPLEKTNVLMKLRETLTDQGDSGTKLTVPEGISVYPSNAILAILGWVSILGMIFGFIWVAAEHD